MRDTIVKIRPANMRTSHGLRGNNISGQMSVSSVACVEDVLADPYQARESGAGMDAPSNMPAGSVKAFFSERNGAKHYCGFCQRTAERE